MADDPRPKIGIVRRVRQRHQEPATAYERMLDRAGADCSTYACWEPIAALVRFGDRIYGKCRDCAMEQGTPENTHWLES